MRTTTRRGSGIIAPLAAAAALSLSSVPAAAQPLPRTKGPCTDCLFSAPAGADPAPLLVVLHGDGEGAASMFDLWAPAASRRGILVFAPACPRSAGCSATSWWRWDGDPTWLHEQVKAIATQRAIDRSRMWIVGWSGGATYLGWNTVEMEREYAALVIHAGGSRPAASTCAPTPAGIYGLVGNMNPLHELTDTLHDYYATTCPHPDLTWTVLAGADHAGERRALPRYREAILDWLSTHRREIADVSPASSSTPAPESGASMGAPTLTPAPAPPPVTPPSPGSSCRCTFAGAPSTAGADLLLLIALLARRARGGASPGKKAVEPGDAGQ